VGDNLVTPVWDREGALSVGGRPPWRPAYSTGRHWSEAREGRAQRQTPPIIRSGTSRDWYALLVQPPQNSLSHAELFRREGAGIGHDRNPDEGFRAVKTGHPQHLGWR
jgi:hypothetical protein